MFGNSFIRNIVIVSLLAILILPCYTIFFLNPSFVNLINENIEDHAVQVANHLANRILQDEPQMERARLPHDILQQSKEIIRDYVLMELKIFSASGEIIFSSDPKDIGEINQKIYFHQVVAKGKRYTKYVKKDTKSLEGHIVSRDVMETYVPIVKNGVFVGAFEIYYDITASNDKLSKVLKNFYLTLFPLVLVLLVMTIVSLFQTRKSLVAREQAEEQRKHVERIVRHDLKAPLNGVINFPAIIESGNNLTEKQKEYLSFIQIAGRRMLNIVNLSLDIIKMEQGNYDCTMEPFDVIPIINRILIDLGLDQIDKKHEVVVSVEGKQGAPQGKFIVPGEESLFEMMLSNIIKNAIEAEKNNDTIDIELSRGDCNTISVHNNSPVPEEIRESFFEKYATCGKKGGTGLGTYTARLMAQTLGGDISMETSESAGTTITVSLPLWQGEAPS